MSTTYKHSYDPDHNLELSRYHKYAQKRNIICGDMKKPKQYEHCLLKFLETIWNCDPNN